MRAVSILSLTLASAHALPEPPAPRFRAETIDAKIKIGYGLAIADVDGDGKKDIVLVDARETVWYKNPTWEKSKLTDSLTPKDHVCVAARDVDGDGKAEVAIGAEWNPSDTRTSGAVFALHAPADRSKPWEGQKLHHEPTVHRMQWVSEKPGLFFLAVLPLHGCGNTNGAGDGVRFLGYRREKDPGKEWATFLLNDSFHMTHNFDPLTWKAGDPGESMLVAAKEGVHLLQKDAETWKATRLTERGAGEVKIGKLPNGKRFIATVEPMHGNEVVVNPEGGGLWSDKRVLLDDTLNQGHALAAADFLGAGYDQVVAGWREPGGPDKKVGLRLYAPANDDGSQWKQLAVVDDNTMACEDMKVADLNGDGLPDLIASGRATKNVIIYWNESGKK